MKYKFILRINHELYTNARRMEKSTFTRKPRSMSLLAVSAFTSKSFCVWENWKEVFHDLFKFKITQIIFSQTCIAAGKILLAHHSCYHQILQNNNLQKACLTWKCKIGYKYHWTEWWKLCFNATTTKTIKGLLRMFKTNGRTVAQKLRTPRSFNPQHHWTNQEL